jgi:GT2 family glycosyltransferase
MMSEPVIAAVFSSFNRKQVALECIARLRAQTRQPDLVVAGDNASTDGSRDDFAALGWPALHVVNTGENLGNAGAVQAAMEKAFELGADAVWILDDDSWPRPEALAALLQDWNGGATVRHSLQIDPRSGAYSWPLPVKSPDGSWKTIVTPADWPGPALVESRASWTGALVPRQAREAAGPVLGDLFIRGEDEEYPRRLAAAGFRFEAVRDSILDHPSATGLRHWRLLGKEFWFEPGLGGWKLYYEVRNNVWLQLNRENSSLRAVLMALLHGVALLAYGPRTFADAIIWWSALCDGFAGKLGRKDFPPP